jgi:glycerol uptake facilitator-like aquaporin
LRAIEQSNPLPPTSAFPEAESLTRRAIGEGLGTAFLLAVIVGSGIMAERLAGGQPAVALLANSLATGAGLVALILALQDFSGAHFNPAVTATDALHGRRPWREVPAYAAAQILGAVTGVAAAHRMFGEPLFTLASNARPGGGRIFAEFVATFGLLAVVFFTSGKGPAAVAAAVGAYITAAYWFTSSTSFANPVVTIARSLTNSFTGIRPADVPGFLAGEALGAAAFAVLAYRLPHRRDHD